MFDDIARIKNLNDLKIQRVSQQLDVLQKCLKESSEQTSKMNGLLSGFDNKLSVLNDLIMPVYDSTNNLQIKHSNITKAINSIDSIIAYYETTKTIAQAIRAGPGKDITSYMTQMDKLRTAAEYFAKNDRNNEKHQIEELWLIGKQNIEREFEKFLVLGKNSKTIEALDTQSINEDVSIDYVDDALSSISSASINDYDLKQIISIFSWFSQVEPQFLEDLFKKLIEFRKEPLLDYLKRCLEDGTSLVIKRQTGPQTNALLSPGVINRNGKMDAFKSKFRDMRSKTFRSASNVNDISKYTNTDSDFDTGDCDNYIKALKKSYQLFLNEKKFIARILNDENNDAANKVLVKIYDPVLRFLKVEAEKIRDNVKHVTNKRTSKFIIALFEVLYELVQLKSNYIRLFEEIDSLNSINNLLEIFIIFEKSCAESLKDIIEEIKTDSKPVSPNGNIHSITAETITYIENLLQFDKIAGLIAHVVLNDQSNQLVPSENELKLRRGQSKNFNPANEAYRFNSAYELKTLTTALVEYFSKIITWLNLNLNSKTESYMDSYIRSIFLMNNYHRILNAFSTNDAKTILQINPNNSLNSSHNDDNKRTLSSLFALAGKYKFKDAYEDKIIECKREYSKCWSKLINYIDDLLKYNPYQDGKLKDKDRQLLKDRFSGFNKEFEDIVETQTKYYIPSPELANQLRRENGEYIVKKYKQFFDTYSRLNFATNREKYIKYTPEELNAKMNEFFNSY